MSMGRPEVEVVLSADDQDLDKELSDAEKKLLDYARNAAKAVVSVGGAFALFTDRIEKLNAAEEKWEQDSRARFNRYTKEITDAQKEIELGFGRIWDSAKRPWEREIAKMLPPLEDISAEAAVAAARWEAFSGEIAKAATELSKFVNIDVKQFLDNTDLKDWLMDLGVQGLKFAVDPLGLGRDVLGGTEEEVGAERRTQEMQKEREAAAQQRKDFEAAMWNMRRHVEQGRAETERIAQEQVDELHKTIQGMWGDKDLASIIMKPGTMIGKTLGEQVMKGMDTAKDGIEAYQTAVGELLSPKRRDEGFQASIQSVTGLARRIQTAAASRAPRDSQAKIEENTGKSVTTQEKILDVLKQSLKALINQPEVDTTARWGGP